MAKIKTREESKLVQEFEQTPVDRLTVHPKNARKGDLEAIGGSIQHNGFFGAIVAQRSTGHILVGNHRYLAAKAAGIEVLPVLWVDVDDKAAKKIMLADNRTNDIASYDNQALLDLLQSLEADLDGTGYDSDALETLLGGLPISESIYTRKVETPVYEIAGDKPAVSELADQQRFAEICERISASSVSAEVKEFLIIAATRHIVFNYRNIAEYYAHSDPVVKDLMEESALVIIDYNKAIELGFVKLTARLGELADADSGEDDE